MYIKITITETGAKRPQDDHSTFNETILYAADMEQARFAVADHYGKMPGMRRKVYEDYREDSDPPGTFPRSRVCGFLHSFWNVDLSHAPVERWHQTDWISVVEVRETVVTFS